MSIIYEALKKIEKNQATPSSAGNKGELQQKRPKNNALKTLGLFLLIAIIGFAVAGLFFSFLTKPLTTKQHLDINIPPAKEPFVSKPEHALAHKEQIPQPKLEAEIAQAKDVSTEKQGLQTDSEPHFVLNGVFFSGAEGYALINNRILKEGDNIGGATVKHISENGIELDLNGNTIKLDSLR